MHYMFWTATTVLTRNSFCSSFQDGVDQLKPQKALPPRTMTCILSDTQEMLSDGTLRPKIFVLNKSSRKVTLSKPSQLAQRNSLPASRGNGEQNKDQCEMKFHGSLWQHLRTWLTFFCLSWLAIIFYGNDSLLAVLQDSSAPSQKRGGWSLGSASPDKLGGPTMPGPNIAPANYMHAV